MSIVILFLTIILFVVNMSHLDGIDIFTIVFNSLLVLLICVLCIRKAVNEYKRLHPIVEFDTTDRPILPLHHEQSTTNIPSLLKSNQ